MNHLAAQIDNGKQNMLLTKTIPCWEDMVSWTFMWDELVGRGKRLSTQHPLLADFWSDGSKWTFPWNTQSVLANKRVGLLEGKPPQSNLLRLRRQGLWWASQTRSCKDVGGCPVCVVIQSTVLSWHDIPSTQYPEDGYVADFFSVILLLIVCMNHWGSVHPWIENYFVLRWNNFQRKPMPLEKKIIVFQNITTMLLSFHTALMIAFLLSLVQITLCRYSSCSLDNCPHNVVCKGLFTIFAKIMAMSGLLS